jgi:hypothetical protein
VIRKKRCTFMIEPEVLERLQSISKRTGLSTSEQIRQGIRWWLESREWPIKGDSSPGISTPIVVSRPAARHTRRTVSKRR